jgi:hypothetical protein
MKSQPTKVKTALKIVLAKNALELVHNDVRKIVSGDPDPNFRGLASIALTSYKDTSDILLLLEALDDPYAVTITNHYALPGHSMKEIVCTVNQDASWALIKCFKVSPDPKSPNGYKYIDDCKK